jgi:hypothetical protein
MAGLTIQEAQIAWMARDGLSNPEIATRLFISARTVQYVVRGAPQLARSLSVPSGRQNAEARRSLPLPLLTYRALGGLWQDPCCGAESSAGAATCGNGKHDGRVVFDVWGRP